jgi:glycosyltransferase involved in cell wall biosynthesis
MVKISVCIATYNGEKYIVDQLRSILNQLKDLDEVVISDDQSTDMTVDLIKGLKEPRIKLFTGVKFRSPVTNFENAIKSATGDIIFLADQDDFWLPQKVEKMCEALQDSDLVVSNCFIGGEDLEIIKDSYFSWRDSRAGFLKNLWRNSYLGCCMAFKQEMLKMMLPFPKGIPMHDMWIGMVAEVFFKPKFLDERLMIYRRHSSNATFLTEDFKSKEGMLKRISFRWNLLRAIVFRALKGEYL